MKETTIEMFEAFTGSFAGNAFLILYLISMIYLFAAEKTLRKKLVLPSLLILAAVCCPPLYKYVWVPLLKYAYWRTLWLLPIVPVIAAAMISILGKIRNRGLALLAVLALFAGAAGTGTYIYKDSFVKVDNLFKLPDDVVQVCEILLKEDEEPRAVMDANMLCYVRQYSSGIHLMYGRDVWGFIDKCSSEAKAVYTEMCQPRPDFDWIADRMSEMGYDYLVTFVTKARSNEEMADYGLEWIADCGDYKIYRMIF